MLVGRSTNTACISKKSRDICNLLLLRILNWVSIDRHSHLSYRVFDRHSHLEEKISSLIDRHSQYYLYFIKP
jgi:hypothetical protein